MAHEGLRDSPTLDALKDLFSDVSDLVRKEIRLAKAELTAKLSAGISAGVWFAAAGFLALVAILLVVQALVFFIASFGLAMHWACLIVAIILLAGAAGLFFYGRSLVRESFEPMRSFEQINEDIRVVRGS
jgi:Putative Actinobacterial Holin-X, holin superfamily III